ncbi:MAG TPA: amidohydrolase [Candidatus Aminicenantes bacterium]|nr:amidohydrolase [Candidatus Aminicenantes bacterium]
MNKRVSLAIMLFCCLSLMILAQSRNREQDFSVIKVKPASMTPLKKVVLSWLDEHFTPLSELNRKIWEYAEIAMEEYRSSALLADFLEKNGFLVQREVAGMPTAFVAVYGTGKPVIGILAEYDALPGLSQDTVPYQKPLEKGKPGHGCGHNIFGVASTAAAVAMKEVMVKNNLPGTIKLFGCPAEETLIGKVFMAREGLFDGLDACIQWHPSARNGVSLGSSNALNQFEVEFFGQTAHAAGDPWHGRSALDAIELTNIGLNYLREHLKPTARIHYVITDGGLAPNVVPDYARAWYYVRDADRESVEEDYRRVLDIIDGAAKMTGTKYKVHFISGVYNLLPNRVGCEVVYSNLLLVGSPSFDEQEQEFAREIQRNLGVETKGLDTEIQPLKLPGQSWGGGSTDVADVSWITPTTTLGIACKPLDTPGHHWSTVACGGMTIGHKAMLTASKVMALTAVDFFTNPEILKKMKEEWVKKTAGKPYKSPLPSDLKPPIKPRPVEK